MHKLEFISQLLSYISTDDFVKVVELLQNEGLQMIPQLDDIELTIIKDALDKAMSENLICHHFYDSVLQYNMDSKGTEDIKNLLVKVASTVPYIEPAS